jgi:hypothetical protein
MKKPALVFHCWIRNVDLAYRNRAVRIELFDAWPVDEVWPGDSRPVYSSVRRSLGYTMYPHTRYGGRTGVVAVIRLYSKSRKLELILLHECMHAANEVADRHKWNPRAEAYEFEEFRVRAAEYLFEHSRRNLRRAGYLK